MISLLFSAPASSSHGKTQYLPIYHRIPTGENTGIASRVLNLPLYLAIGEVVKILTVRLPIRRDGGVNFSERTFVTGVNVNGESRRPAACRSSVLLCNLQHNAMHVIGRKVGGLAGLH